MNPRYVVSACLAGCKCRYDGSDNRFAPVERLVAAGLALALCPEELGGLETPREPCELRNGRVLSKSGSDCTQAFTQGAQKALKIALDAGCAAAIVKSRSPSCGPNMVYDGTFSKKLIPGTGIWATMLLEAGLSVYTEEDFS